MIYHIKYIIIFQGLIYDILGVNEEKQYTYEAELGTGETKQKKVLLDLNDPLWMKNRFKMFQLAHSIFY